jgi:FO synthase subunit 1
LAQLQRRWGHLQEVILQPWRPDGEQGRPLDAQERCELLATIVLARRLLPPEVHLQMPPNLLPLQALPEALEAGIDDLGGIDSTDVINPAYPQPTPQQLAALLERQGWRLRPRLCVHRRWWPWLPAALRRRVEYLAQGLSAAPTSAIHHAC